MYSSITLQIFCKLHTKKQKHLGVGSRAEVVAEDGSILLNLAEPNLES